MHGAGPQAVGGPAEELPVVALLDAAQPQPGHEHRVRHLRVLLANIQYVDTLNIIHYRGPVKHYFTGLIYRATCAMILPSLLLRVVTFSGG